MNSVSTLLEAMYEMCMCVARPVYGLLHYLIVDIHVEPRKNESPKGGSNKKK